MQHTFFKGDQQHDVTIKQKGERYTVCVGEREYDLRDVHIDNGTVCFAIGHRTIRIFVSHDRRGTQLHYDGRNYFVDSVLEEENVAGHHHAGDGCIAAPMPGAIIGVNVAVGDQVESGASLVVIESMKMQNDISAPLAGEVVAVNCKAGDQVGFGDLLVEIKANNP